MIVLCSLCCDITQKCFSVYPCKCPCAFFQCFLNTFRIIVFPYILSLCWESSCQWHDNGYAFTITLEDSWCSRCSYFFSQTKHISVIADINRSGCAVHGRRIISSRVNPCKQQLPGIMRKKRLKC